MQLSLVLLICVLVVLCFSGKAFAGRSTHSSKAAQLLQAFDSQVEHTGKLCGPRASSKKATADGNLPVVGSELECIVQELVLGKTQQLGQAWTKLGAYLDGSGDEDANVVFQEAQSHMGICSGHIHTWQALGPFPMGKGEMDGDPLGAYGGIQNVTVGDRKIYYSELVKSGRVKWTTLKAEGATQETVSVQFANADWNGVYQTMNNDRTHLEFQAWLVGELYINQPGFYEVHMTGLHTLFVGDTPLNGDQYRTGMLRAQIELARGVHTVRIRVKGSHQAQFSLKFTPLANPFSVQIAKPRFLPDLVDRRLFSGHLAVPFLNQGTEYVQEVVFHVTPAQGTDRQFTPQIVSQVSIAPGQLTPVPFELTTFSANLDLACPSVFLLQAEATFANGHSVKSNRIRLELECRNYKTQSFLFSYPAFDGSVHQAGAISPQAPCYDVNEQQIGCPVVVSMHGMGATARGMADSYKYMNKKEQWFFGVRDMWVVTPSRHGAHNWEGIGSQTVTAALLFLEARAQTFNTQTKLTADLNRLLVTGHSMGGHGAWVYATQHPDQTMCLLPAGGWVKKATYGDSNNFFAFDIQVPHLDKFLQQLFEASIHEDDIDTLVPNLVGIPTIVRVGQEDRTVAPYYSRRMVRVLKEANQYAYHSKSAVAVETPSTAPPVKLSEIPGKEHWFWDTKTTNDGGVVNDKELRGFYKYCAAKPSVPQLPPIFTHTTNNPSSVLSRGGFVIVQLSKPFQRGTMTRSGHVVRTTNVARFTLTEVPGVFSASDVPAQGWIVDGTIISREMVQSLFTDAAVIAGAKLNVERLATASAFHLCRQVDRSWQACAVDETFLREQRRPGTSGPMRQVFEQRFVVVIGTQQGKEHTEKMQARAVYFANLHAMAFDTNVEVYLDTDYSYEVNTNVVLFGGVDSNAVTASLFASGDKLPVSFNVEIPGWTIGGVSYDAPGSGIVSLLPLSLTTQAGTDKNLLLLMDAVDDAGWGTLLKLAEPTIPPMVRAPFTNMMPDYVVTGPLTDWQGLGGLQAAGYWGNHWEFRPDIAYSVLL